jgi:hypothetical protein
MDRLTMDRLTMAHSVDHVRPLVARDLTASVVHRTVFELRGHTDDG